MKTVSKFLSGIVAVEAALSCKAPCTYNGSALPVPLPLSVEDSTRINMGGKYIISTGNN